MRYLTSDQCFWTHLYKLSPAVRRKRVKRRREKEKKMKKLNLILLVGFLYFILRKVNIGWDAFKNISYLGISSSKKLKRTCDLCIVFLKFSILFKVMDSFIAWHSRCHWCLFFLIRTRHGEKKYRSLDYLISHRSGT